MNNPRKYVKIYNKRIKIPVWGRLLGSFTQESTQPFQHNRCPIWVGVWYAHLFATAEAAASCVTSREAAIQAGVLTALNGIAECVSS